MKKAMFVALAVVLVIGSMVGLSSAAVGNTQQQGSLVVFPKIMVVGQVDEDGKWVSVTTDTLVTMVNNYRGTATDPGDVLLECYWMTDEQDNGSFSWFLTHTDPDYMFASERFPGRVLPQPVTDPPTPIIYPADAIGLGEIKCWAVDASFSNQIKFNYLFGTATIFDYTLFTAEQYSSMNFKANGAAGSPTRSPVGTPGQIVLDGALNYDACPARVMGTFFPMTASFTDFTTTIDAFTTDLTLVPCTQSLGQDAVPIWGKAEILLWDYDETRMDTIYVCYKCWMETTLTPVPVVSAGVEKTYGFSVFDEFDGDVAYFEARGVRDTACGRDPVNPGVAIFGLLRTTAKLTGGNVVQFATHLNATSTAFATPSTITWGVEPGGDPNPEMGGR